MALDKLHVTNRSSHEVRFEAPVHPQSVNLRAKRFVITVNGCARKGCGQSKFGCPTHDHRRLRLKHIVSLLLRHGAGTRDGIRILSTQFQSNRVTN
jgi:hypothetical protein